MSPDAAIAYKKGRVSKSIKDDSGFPIFSKENPSKFDDMLRGIQPSAKAIIEDLQPYNRGHRFTNDPLWQLNKLSIEDKHRLPHVTPFTSISFSSITIPDGPGVDEIEPINFTVEDRAPIARYPTVDQTGAKVNVKLTPTFSIGFGHRAPKQLRGMSVPDRLRRIHRYVAKKVLPNLVGYLN